MIITWNMQPFIVEGSFLHRTASAFFTMPSRGRPEKNKYTAINLPCVKPCSFSAQRCGVYLFNYSLWTKSYSVPLISINDCIHKNQVPCLTQIYQNSQ